MRRRAKQALRESEERHRLLAETMLQGVVHHDAEGKIIAMNPAAERILGKTPEQFLGSNSVEEEHHTIREDGTPFPGLEHPAMVALRTGQSLRGVVMGVFNPKADTYRWISIDAVPVFRPGENRPAEVYAVFEDVTERRRSEQLLQAAHERTETILRSITDAFFALGRDWRFTYVNAETERLLRKPAVELLQHNVWDLFPDAEAFRDRYEQVLVTGQAVHFEEFYAPLAVWFEVHAYPNDNGLSIYFRNATERRQGQEELRLSEGRLRRAQEIAHLGSWELDVVNDRLTWSDEVYRIFGFQPQEFQATYEAFLDAVHPDDRAAVDAAYSSSLREGRDSYEIEHRVVRKSDGEVRIVHEKCENIRDGSGRIIRSAGMVHDITERKQAEERLRDSEQQFRTLADSIPNLAWWANGDGYITWYNRQWYEYTGTTPEQMEGWGWQSVHDPDELPRVLERWTASLATGKPFNMELPLRGCDGQFRWFLTRVLPLKDAGGRVVRWFGTNTDVTEVRQARQAAEAANIAKSQFLANMSHELRTPMNAIMGMTDLALGEDLSPTLRDYLQTVKQSADGLLELVNEILDLARIEAGGFQLEATPFDLRKTVDQVAKTLAVRAYEKGLELVCDLGEVPTQLVGDPLRLRQVLTNLVGNAVKFTSKGAVVVSAAVVSKEPQEVVLQFAVADTGIGIASEDQERIFAPFTQADASTTRQYGGTGLGLTITQRLVDLMGGRIWVESEPDKGSTFRFTVRFELQEGREEDPRLPAVSHEAMRDLPVLVVAENPTSGRILVETFRRWSMKPEMADDVPTALAKTHKAASEGRNFRLILADAMLPGIDGFTLAQWLRNNAKLAGPVILMLSAADRCKRPKCCQDVGALYLEKPISQSALFNLVAEALGIQQQAGKSADSALAAIPEAPARLLRVLLAEDTPANQKLVTYVLSKRGHAVEVAQNGQQTLEAVGQQDFDVVLMDVQMPVMDGFQATAEIRKLDDRKKARLPIIAMTAHALKGDVERCLAAGMDGYISKPVKGEELIELVERLAGAGGSVAQVDVPLERERSRAAVAESETKDVVRRAAAGGAGVFDLSEALSKCDGNYGIVQQMVGCFFNEADSLIEKMRAALSTANATELGNTAHRLKGTVLYLGASAAADATQRVERIGKSGDLTEAADAIDELAIQIERLTAALVSHRRS